MIGLNRLYWSKYTFYPIGLNRLHTIYSVAYLTLTNKTNISNKSQATFLTIFRGNHENIV